MTYPGKFLLLSLALLAAVLLAPGNEARAYCPPPCPGAGTSAAVTAAQSGVQNLVQRITSGQLSIEQARSMANEMEKTTGQSVAAQQLRDAAEACEKSGNCVAPAASSSTAPAALIAVPVPASNLNKPGALYLAIITNGSVFFVDSAGKITPYEPGKTPPATYTGSLAPDNLQMSDLSDSMKENLPKGAQVVAGYGLGVPGLSDPFDNMIKNASYNVTYTKP